MNEVQEVQEVKSRGLLRRVFGPLAAFFGVMFAFMGAAMAEPAPLTPTEELLDEATGHFATLSTSAIVVISAVLGLVVLGVIAGLIIRGVRRGGSRAAG